VIIRERAQQVDVLADDLTEVDGTGDGDPTGHPPTTAVTMMGITVMQKGLA
jgi:hypothetical protein